MIISYYAIFRYESDGININFPDIPNAFTCAYSFSKTKLMASEVLELMLHKKRIKDLPVASNAQSIPMDSNESIELISVTMCEKDGVLFGHNIIEYD